MLTRPADNAPDATVLCMRRSSMVLGAVASVLAPVAGVMAYQSWAPSPTRAVDSAAAGSVSTGSSPDPVLRYRPCRRPARLEGGVCVTHRVRVAVATPADASAPLSSAAPGTGDPGPVRPSDHASPTHPVHHPPTHETNPSGEPNVTATAMPTEEPSAPPTCDPTDQGNDGDDDGYDDGYDERADLAADRAGGGPLGWMAESVGPQLVTRSDDWSPSDCESEDEDEGDGDDGDEDDGDHGGVATD
jgi:hypothetical protein